MGSYRLSDPHIEKVIAFQKKDTGNFRKRKFPFSTKVRQMVSKSVIPPTSFSFSAKHESQTGNSLSSFPSSE